MCRRMMEMGADTVDIGALVVALKSSTRLL
jgi:hypothetical protein